MRALALRLDAALRQRATSAEDIALSTALLVLVLGELAVDDSTQHPLVVAAVVASLVALAWRRHAPLLVAVAVLSASVLLSVTADGEFPPQLPLLADLLVVYTVAAQLAGRRAVAAAAVTLVLLWAGHVATGDGDAGDFLPFLFWGAPWAAGRLVRRRTLDAAASAHRAALVERHRDEQMREAAARERDRIARELHDVVAHGVSLMVVQAGAERLRLAGAGGDDAARTREVLDAVERAGRTALSELRAMLGVLRETEPTDGGDAPVARSPQPGLADLPALADRVRAAGVPVALEMGPEPHDVPPAVGLSAYRIVQEALTNVVKHAPGSRTTVTVVTRAGTLAVHVVSPLPAVPDQTSGCGRGLVGMAERATVHGGTATAGPVDGRWHVHAELPYSATVSA